MFKKDDKGKFILHPLPGSLMSPEEMKHGVEGLSNVVELDDLLTALLERPSDDNEDEVHWTESEYGYPGQKSAGFLAKVRNNMVNGMRYTLDAGPLNQCKIKKKDYDTGEEWYETPQAWKQASPSM